MAQLQPSIERWATAVGARVEYLLRGASQASTKCVTRRGVFALTARDSMFLSAEAMGGPPTVTLCGGV